MRVSIINKNGTELVDRYSNEEFFAQRAQDEPDKIFFLPECWENLIASWRYKPGWTLEYAYDISFDQERLYIDAKVPDRDDPEKLTRVGNWYNLEPWADLAFDMHREYIRFCIRDMEIHEMDEHILIDGVRVFDPHVNEEN